MGCGHTSPRQPFQDLLAELNPGAAEAVRRIAQACHDAEGARWRSLSVGAGERDDGQVLTDCWSPSRPPVCTSAPSC